MQAVRIVALCILAAVGYGIGHNLITAHVCVEYFTIGHPRIFRTDAPILLALGWGVIGTWWVGLLLGIPLALVSRIGARPKRTARSLWRPVVILLAVMAACALIAGIAGWVLAQQGRVFLLEPLHARVPAAQHSAFIADLWAHLASYCAGLVGGIVVIVQVWRARSRAALQPAPASPQPTAPVSGTTAARLLR